ncbi:DNA replication and repair protein RecR [Thiothrix eikelboomii]|uniref:Recombination protein RecR n=1 Tax=Thiothrix eikelboomii TaxID=92487 RepID=A0A1T4WYZ9_9GAMM|nr:recombination mediator RecR [Thiothrix eikelboomii]SKA82479.1 DNA replication and repair protein RecR [Thiothrix eikelboomii]
MSESSLLKELVDALRCLPGVGARTAQRMAFHLLEHDRQGGERLARVMAAAMQNIQHCERCRTLTEQTICRLCSNPARDASLLCVVEHPSDVVAIEQATAYRGYYFVLGGRLSPLDGIGPDDIGLDRLEQRLDEGSVQELILATNPTVEGEVTAHYISELAAKRQVSTSRIAHGVPMGSELEYVDSGTLSHAFEGRRKY